MTARPADRVENLVERGATGQPRRSPGGEVGTAATVGHGCQRYRTLQARRCRRSAGVHARHAGAHCTVRLTGRRGDRAYSVGMYSDDVLSAARRPRRSVREVPAEADLVVETADGRFCGAVVECGRTVVAGEQRDTVTLADRFDRRRVFPMLTASFLLEGELVTLVRPSPIARGARAGQADRVRLGGGRRCPGPGRPGQPHLGGGRARRSPARADLG